MPAYDYRCISCDTVFEVVRPIGQTGDVACPSCGAEAKRIFTPVGMVLKGSGFHNTDYRRPPKEAPASKSCSGNDSPACSGCPSKSE